MNMKRQDYDLAFMLKFENVAWYENGKVRILDRRVYPREVRYVTCNTNKEVAIAIRDMVTQSEGPYLAAAMGMALATYEARNMSSKEYISFIEQAVVNLTTARPTTSAQMKEIVLGSRDVILKGISEGKAHQDITQEAFEYAYNYANNNYHRYSIIGEKVAEKLPNNGKVLTQCFAGTVVGTIIRACKSMNKDVKFYCAETRPYYQGSRLTASVACDMGVDVTVICDNMPAYTMQQKKIDMFTSASDVITMDGHVINKVGTFQIALAAKHLGIPYYVTGTPDKKHEGIESITIEERDPELVLKSLDTKLTMPGVKGFYPAFDITPPELVTGIVTQKAIYEAKNVRNYFTD